MRDHFLALSKETETAVLYRPCLHYAASASFDLLMCSGDHFLFRWSVLGEALLFLGLNLLIDSNSPGSPHCIQATGNSCGCRKLLPPRHLPSLLLPPELARTLFHSPGEPKGIISSVKSF